MSKEVSNVCDFRDTQAPLLHARHIFIINRWEFVIGSLGGYSVARNSVKSQSSNPEVAVEHTECGDAKIFTFSVICRKVEQRYHDMNFQLQALSDSS